MIRRLRRINLYGGYIFLFFFIISGFYLYKNVKNQEDDSIHMSGRANHIYLLFITIINFVYGKIHMPSGLLSLLVRLLMILSGICAVIGFFKEICELVEERKLMPSSVAFSFISFILFLLNNKKEKTF